MQFLGCEAIPFNDYNIVKYITSRVPGNTKTNDVIRAKLNKALCRLKMKVIRGISRKSWNAGNHVKMDLCLISSCLLILDSLTLVL